MSSDMRCIWLKNSSEDVRRNQLVDEVIGDENGCFHLGLSALPLLGSVGNGPQTSEGPTNGISATRHPNSAYLANCVAEPGLGKNPGCQNPAD